MTDARLKEKAKRTLEAARRALLAGDSETAADRAYYAAYYAAWALLDATGLPRSKTYQGLIAEFSRQFVKEGPFTPDQGVVLSRLESLRLQLITCVNPYVDRCGKGCRRSGRIYKGTV